MVQLVAIAGSLRQDSFNRKALQNALSFVEGEDIEVQKLDLEKLDLPVFNEDLEARAPESVRELQRAIAKADLIVIATPEYNRSLPSGLKNAVDWISRIGSVPLTSKVVVLLGASTGGFGTVRAQIFTSDRF